MLTSAAAAHVIRLKGEQMKNDTQRHVWDFPPSWDLGMSDKLLSLVFVAVTRKLL